MTCISIVYKIPDLSYLEGNACTGFSPPQTLPVCIIKLRLEVVVLISLKRESPMISLTTTSSTSRLNMEGYMVRTWSPSRLLSRISKDFIILSCTARAILLCKSSSIPWV